MMKKCNLEPSYGFNYFPTVHDAVHQAMADAGATSPISVITESSNKQQWFNTSNCYYNVNNEIIQDQLAVNYSSNYIFNNLETNALSMQMDKSIYIFL